MSYKLLIIIEMVIFAGILCVLILIAAAILLTMAFAGCRKIKEIEDREL